MDAASLLLLAVAESDRLRPRLLALVLVLVLVFLVAPAALFVVRQVRRALLPREPRPHESKYPPADDWYRKPLVPPVESPASPPDPKGDE